MKYLISRENKQFILKIVKIIEEEYRIKGIQEDQANSPQTLSEEDQLFLQVANRLFVGLLIVEGIQNTNAAKNQRKSRQRQKNQNQLQS